MAWLFILPRKQVAYIRDYDGTQIRAITSMTDFKDAVVLDIGCGEGFLTFAYAPIAALVVAIDVDADRIVKARAVTPPELTHILRFQVSDIASYQFERGEALFDYALFAWSL